MPDLANCNLSDAMVVVAGLPRPKLRLPYWKKTHLASSRNKVQNVSIFHTLMGTYLCHRIRYCSCRSSSSILLWILKETGGLPSFSRRRCGHGGQKQCHQSSRQGKSHVHVHPLLPPARACDDGSEACASLSFAEQSADNVLEVNVNEHDVEEQLLSLISEIYLYKWRDVTK